MSEASMLKTYWPIIVVAAGVIASGAVAQSQIAANKEGIVEIEEKVDENGKRIIELQRRADRRDHGRDERQGACRGDCRH